MNAENSHERFAIPVSEIISSLGDQLDLETKRRAEVVLAAMSRSSLVKNHREAVKFIKTYHLIVGISHADLMNSASPENEMELKRKQYETATEAILNTPYFQKNRPENILFARGLERVTISDLQKLDPLSSRNFTKLIVQKCIDALTACGITNFDNIENEMDRGPKRYGHTKANRTLNELAIEEVEIDKIRNLNPALYDYLFTQESN